MEEKTGENIDSYRCRRLTGRTADWIALRQNAVTGCMISVTHDNLLIKMRNDEAVVVPVVVCGGVCFWRESGMRRSVLCWCISNESHSSLREDVFTFYLVCKEMLQILCFRCDFRS